MKHGIMETDKPIKSLTACAKRIHFQRSGGGGGGSSGATSSASTGSLNIPLDLKLWTEFPDIRLEDERPILPGVPVRAASLPSLVKLCVQAFDPTGHIHEDFTSFPRILFLMHRWFTCSYDLATLFISEYKQPGVKQCEDLKCIHTLSDDSNFTCKECKYKNSVLQALRYWIANFPIHFALNESLCHLIRTFFEEIKQSVEVESTFDIFQLNELPSYDWIRNVSLREVDSIKPSRKVSLVFNHLEPNELAQHLTFLEHKIVRRITFEDFKSYAENGTLDDNPRLERSVSLFNSLSQWIQCVVLTQNPTPAQRASVIVKFVRVAKNLRNLQNYNSLMAVVGSLSHSALARLSKTMECVPTEEKKILADLTKLVSSVSNFSSYRKVLQESKGFKIPILGVHLKDLISLHTALPDIVEDGLINFRKMTQLSLIFQELQELQQLPPPTQASKDLLNTLKVSLEVAYSEDEIYELSLTREPKILSSSPTRSPVSEGIGTRTENYEKQVQMMVDAVFRNFDSNHDGYINKDEYQAILSNFPSIDSFCVLDENRDGMISKVELEKYLRSRKMGHHGRHSWKIHSYFKPTFCIHCSGLLWGLIKQGYKCQNCGVNAHKYCKEYMLHECKADHFIFLSSSEPQAKRRGFRGRKKSTSGHSESGSPPSPKLFTSLEQLSLSLESNDSNSGRSQSLEKDITHSTHMHLGTTTKGEPGTSSPKVHTGKCGSGSSSSSRKISLIPRPSLSVPSSPKLGLSIPLWSPCRTIFHNLASSATSSRDHDDSD